jgi:hypothetical protein
MRKVLPIIGGGCEPALELVHMLREQTQYSLQTCAIIALVGAVKEAVWEIEDLKDVYIQDRAQAEAQQ